MSFLKFLERIPDILLPNLKAKSHTLYIVWREVCHLIGSLFLLVVSHGLMLVSSLNVPLFVFVALFAWLLFQEFYRHPKMYHQKLWKGILDVVVWVTPFALYFWIL